MVSISVFQTDSASSNLVECFYMFFLYANSTKRKTESKYNLFHCVAFLSMDKILKFWVSLKF